ncbi:exopolysaccharide biosynthesis polyprenyl glycosylphosphotransferase [Sphingomonas solaris]|uniref:Exopolysaccharide biosynthesis polyprenyl glycosylphosphotransferase n=2 Tax=Alterirhizorhabdus solaris TaxID=2529389 RepID=A0A558QRM4_9SPHN|nr:exopolysaccharide biosynthesis polyprenyl glycosylphosphotransferase [Sphingomonas solaris]
MLLLTLDGTAVLTAFGIGSLLRFGNLSSQSAFDMAVVTLPVFLGVALNSGAYSIDVLRANRVGIARASSSLGFTFCSLLLLFYYLRVLQDVSRLAIGAGMIGSFVLVAAFRTLFSFVVHYAVDGAVTSELVILDEVSFPVPATAKVIDAAANGLRPDLRDPMMLDRLAKRIRGIDRVVIACRAEAQRPWAMLLKGANIQGEIVTTEFDAVGAIGIRELGGRTTLLVASGPLSLRNRMVKRAFDLLFAVPALILLAPMLLFVAFAIRFDSKGPVFFRQMRVGRGNELFAVYKFRSMLVDQCDEAGSLSTQRDDSRITRVGAFIRKTSIDELPQLLNVLFGSMSIVGPRPHALGSLAGQQLFWDVDERYWHRHALKPGITGLAQVRGFRGATYRRDDLMRRLQADLEYIAGWSVWRDFKILVSTATVVIHKNAY